MYLGGWAIVGRLARASLHSLRCVAAKQYRHAGMPQSWTIHKPNFNQPNEW